MTGKVLFSFYCSITIVFIVLCIGWVLNLIEIVSTFSGPLTGMLIARLVGVFAMPLGGILGYF